MSEVKIRPYLQEQIKAEEEFHDWLKIMLASVLLALLADVKNGRYSPDVLTATTAKFKQQHYFEIKRKSNEIATNIVTIANNSLVTTNNTVSRAGYNAIAKNNLSKSIESGIGDLIDQVRIRVQSIIPFGYAGLYSDLFTDENNSELLSKRTNNSSMRFARQVYTEGVFNNLINLGSLYGYTEYLADNRHDNKVRPLHAKYFVTTNWIAFNKPPPCGHVGSGFNCRCFLVAVR